VFPAFGYGVGTATIDRDLVRVGVHVWANLDSVFLDGTPDTLGGCHDFYGVVLEFPFVVPFYSDSRLVPASVVVFVASLLSFLWCFVLFVLWCDFMSPHG